MFLKLFLVIKPFNITKSEGITDGEVECLMALEGVGVEVSRLVGIVRHVQAKSPVEAQDEERQVVANADTGGKSRLLEDVTELEISRRQVGLVIVVVSQTLPASRKMAP